MKQISQTAALVLGFLTLSSGAFAFLDRHNSKSDIQGLALGHRPPDFQGGTLQCRAAKTPAGTVVFAYVIKATESRRLGSDILRVDASNVATIISSLNVAQYQASDSDLYMLIDDNIENPVLSFSASFVRKPKKSAGDPPNTLTYEGRIEEITDGTVTRIQRVICKLTA